MDKLTWYDNDGRIMCRRGYEVALARLASCEATGLMPEQVANAKAIIESAFADDASKAERIRKLLAADKEGRVLILPCKRGDGIYICSAGRAWRFWVTDVSTLNGRTVLNVQGFGTIAADDIGKTAFLSLEEAERALEEQKNV